MNFFKFTALYDSDDEGDVEMESQGSVIRHLLSQVKIGMDLTKVVLPTFILERRSLLEMYADYFAHPDLFIRYGIEHRPVLNIIYFPNVAKIERSSSFSQS